MRIWQAGAVLAVVVGIWPSAATAGGSLDASFGASGIVTTDFGLEADDAAGDLAVDGSGRMVVAGESDGQVAVARYSPTGVLDLSFGGGDGLVTTNFGRLEDFFGGLAVDSADRIIVSATTSGDTSCTDCDIAVARFTATGELDPDFGGGDGKVITDMGTGLSNSGSDLAVDTSDRIVVAGTVRREDPPDFSDFAVVRYTETGELDPTFDGDGRVTTDLDGVTQSGRAVALDGTGRIVVGGETAIGSGFAFAAARYLETGALDTSFSGDGKVVTDVAPGENSLTSGLAVDPSGRIVLGGTVLAGSPAGSDDVVLLRYLTGGALDPSFGLGDGIVATATGSEGRGNSLAIDASGRIVVAGSQAEQVYADVTLRRYLADGSLDSTFGAGSLVEADLGTASSDYASGVALTSEGRIVIAGATGPLAQATSPWPGSCRREPSCRRRNSRPWKYRPNRPAPDRHRYLR